MKLLIVLATIAATQAGLVPRIDPVLIPNINENLKFPLASDAPPLQEPTGTPPNVMPGQERASQDNLEPLPLLPPTKLRDLPLDEKTRATLPVGTVNLKLDQFNALDNRTIPIRYAFNNNYWYGRGPLYIFVGGESNFEPMFGYFTQGPFAESAGQNRALMFMNEHRFYGKSMPAGGQTLSNLQYLTVKQSMADLAILIRAIKAGNPGISKVVLWGGSYPGSLAAWMRLKYPTLVDMAVSSSSITTIRRDNPGFNNVVTSSVNAYSPACRNTISNGFQYIVNKVATTQGQTEMQNYFGLSYSLAPTLNRNAFFNGLIYPIGQTVQYDKQTSRTSIAEMCGNFIKPNPSLTETQKFMQLMKNAMQTGIVKQATSSDPDGRSWFWQVCYELSNVVTTTTYWTQMFGNRNNVPLSYWNAVCTGLFNLSVAQQNAGNQALDTFTSDIKCATKVIYTVGTNDPWRAVGMTSPPNTQTQVYVVPDSSHCAVLTPARVVNSPALTAAREGVKNQIRIWLTSA